MHAGRWNYTRFPGTPPLQEELFDLQADPREEQSLAADPAQAARRGRFRARTDEFHR